MKLFCAWCLQEGVPAFLGEVEPLDDPTVTHGICGRHRFEFLQELATADRASTRGPGGEGKRGRREVSDAHNFLSQWIADSREVRDRLLPNLLAERSSLMWRAETAERTNRSLEVRLAALRREVIALQRERQTLTNVHTQVAELVNSLVGRLGRDVIQPLHDLLAKLSSAA